MADWLDVRLVRFCGRSVRTLAWLVFEPEQGYGLARSLLLTVVGGVVSWQEEMRRKEFCDHSGPLCSQCPARRTVGGIEFCMEHDVVCNNRCPKTWWWVPGWLVSRRLLRRWGCPRGYWQPNWCWLDACKYGILRVVARGARCVCPGVRHRARAKKAVRSTGCCRVHLDIVTPR